MKGSGEDLDSWRAAPFNCCHVGIWGERSGIRIEPQISPNFSPSPHYRSLPRGPLPCALIFYCCVTNYHKPSSLKKRPIISQFCSPQVQANSAELLLRVPQSQNQGVGWAWPLSGSRGRSASMFICSSFWAMVIPRGRSGQPGETQLFSSGAV